MIVAKIRAKCSNFRILFSISAVLFSNGLFSQIYTVNACPGENTDSQINISWCTDTNIKKSFVVYTTIKDSGLKKIKSVTPQVRVCTVFDSIYSKSPDNKDIYENAIFNKCDAALSGLKKNTEYLYWIVRDKADPSLLTPERARRFKTSGAKEWSACIISDFHSYTPLPKRQVAATEMLDKICEYDKEVDWILHLGDVTAWGGSYSFWKNLYENRYFKNYMWAGVNGNHDNMTRKYLLSNRFFRNVNFYPNNGYEGEEGVCYYFKYHNVLFIMLNNENMRTEPQFQRAAEWVRKVVKENKADYTVVCEHYQWFFGKDGKASQYGRWSDIFDELGIDLALAGNNHIYLRTNALYNGKETDGTKGTVYVQTPSSDNERGSSMNEELQANADIIKFRWTEGPKTVGALHLKVTAKEMTLLLINRHGDILDSVKVLKKNK